MNKKSGREYGLGRGRLTPSKTSSTVDGDNAKGVLVNFPPSLLKGPVVNNRYSPSSTAPNSRTKSLGLEL